MKNSKYKKQKKLKYNNKIKIYTKETGSFQDHSKNRAN